MEDFTSIRRTLIRFYRTCLLVQKPLSVLEEPQCFFSIHRNNSLHLLLNMLCVFYLQ